MIVHVVAGGGLYGMERVLINLLPALRRRGVPVGLMCLVPRDDTVAPEVGQALSASGVPTAYVRGFWYNADVRAALAVWRPTAFHVHGYKAAMAGGMFAQFASRPLFATYHAEADAAVRSARGFARTRFHVYVAMETVILRRAWGIAAVSERIRDQLVRRGITPARVAVVANGIRPAASRTDTSRSAAQIVIVGRLVGGKNVHVAIEALGAIRRTHPAAQLVIAGTGPLEEALRSTARRLGLADAVRFAGFVSDIPGLLAQSACVVMPSSSEGMPLVILEAMAAKTPIVASAVGAIPEVVRDNQEALLIPHTDGAALADRVTRLLADRSLRDRLTTAAHARFAAEYTDEAMAARYESFYAQHLK